ncbi:MAG: DUF1016 domain-containing protein [Defluviitaleaceae bacterium]|nr:DUF1016 domain-containing protein [Defluviitaleaceae bacterium]
MNNDLMMYATFIKDIKKLIYHRQYEAMKMVNKNLPPLVAEISRTKNYAIMEKCKIICKSKHRTRVEYTLKPSNVAIGVSTYLTKSNLPKNLQASLSSPDEITKIVSAFDDDGWFEDNDSSIRQQPVAKLNDDEKRGDTND